MFNLRVTFKFEWWVPKNESKALKMASEGKDTEGGRARFDRILQIVSGGVVPKPMNGGLCPSSSCHVGSDNEGWLIVSSRRGSSHCVDSLLLCRSRHQREESHDHLLWHEEHVTSVFVLVAMVQSLEMLHNNLKDLVFGVFA